MMKPDTLTRAWIALIVFSALSMVAAGLVNNGFDQRLTGSLVLALALLKARVILSRYLGLADAPSWRRGFNLALTLFCLILLGLYLFPQI
ncbi:cytochrome C oxidase subunit IV family protein [Litoreibacter arenae]|uniref:Nitric oxide reductase F protein, putative n=1 Tax=Litoreibacter arenae DSM 19593 TaxID=1123360 RepID=S9QP91_9RHOB|nr:cytochrome C oxidase subunit IV family protein [Litoreibacter arenae]EPX81477.1 nitric oxide reductase F protein, putative [Litoreibacter arenae DSM 19593]